MLPWIILEPLLLLPFDGLALVLEPVALESVAVADPVAAVVAELFGSALVLAVTSAGCVPLGLTSNELEV